MDQSAVWPAHKEEPFKEAWSARRRLKGVNATAPAAAVGGSGRKATRWGRKTTAAEEVPEPKWRKAKKWKWMHDGSE